MADYPDLLAGETVLPQDELMHRQVTPGQHQDGEPLLEAFAPTREHDRKLSVACNSKVSAEEAFVAHTDRGLASVGSWPIWHGTVQEVELRAVDDSALDGVPDYHGYVDFRRGTRAERKMAADTLREAAVVEGPTFLPRGTVH